MRVESFCVILNPVFVTGHSVIMRRADGRCMGA